MPRFKTYLPRITVQSGNEPNENEAALFALLASHPEQQRSACNLHQTLCKVARMRCVDMATRNYLKHVDPDGLGPNFHARAAGYRLPIEWPMDIDKNFIESIGGGYPTAQRVWDAWLDSPPHRGHALGEGAHWGIQLNLGCGYAFNADSLNQHYFCMISAPVES